MSKETRAILLVADISGFTKFMKSHIISISHAKQVIVRLLKAIIKSSRSPLKIAELEGDAVFYYAACNEKNLEKIVAEVKLQMIRFFNSFSDEIDILTGLDACSCEACMKTKDLKLKIVVHIGNIYFEKLNRTEKLFGLDVIVVHRMLKNSVPSKEYVMMTEEAHSDFVDFYGLEGERFREDLEGIGELDMLVFYPEKIPDMKTAEKSEKRPYSLIERFVWKTTLTKNTVLDWCRIIKIKGNFKHEA